MRACAKANVFLKMLGLNARGYHILGSRFVLLDEIYDEIELCKDKGREGFEIITEFSSEFGAGCEKKGEFNAEFGANGGKKAEFNEKFGVERGIKGKFSDEFKAEHEINAKFGAKFKAECEIKGKAEFSGFNATPEIKGENIIETAYKMLRERGFEGVLNECFSQFSLKLTKKIPIGGGLGGGSADAACFLLLMNETLNLGLSRDELMQMGARLGSDVPFFISGFKSANVGGTGEIIAEFEDEIPPLKFIFPPLECCTASVYAEFDRGLGVNFGDFCGVENNFGTCKNGAKGEFSSGEFEKNANLSKEFTKNAILAKEFPQKTSKELLESYENALLNDLFAPCVRLYPQMAEFLRKGYFLSGSGSTVFKAEF